MLPTPQSAQGPRSPPSSPPKPPTSSSRNWSRARWRRLTMTLSRGPARRLRAVPRGGGPRGPADRRGRLGQELRPRIHLTASDFKAITRVRGLGAPGLFEGFWAGVPGFFRRFSGLACRGGERQPVECRAHPIMIGAAFHARRLSRHAGRPRLAGVLTALHQGERSSTGEAASVARSSPPCRRSPQNLASQGPESSPGGFRGSKGARARRAHTHRRRRRRLRRAGWRALRRKRRAGPGGVRERDAAAGAARPAIARTLKRPSNAPAPQSHPPSIPLFGASSRR